MNEWPRNSRWSLESKKLIAEVVAGLAEERDSRIHELFLQLALSSRSNIHIYIYNPAVIFDNLISDGVSASAKYRR